MPPIGFFMGAFLGFPTQAMRHDGKSMLKRARATLVVTEPALNRAATPKATTIIHDAGGEMIQTPKPGTSKTDQPSDPSVAGRDFRRQRLTTVLKTTRAARTSVC